MDARNQRGRDHKSLIRGPHRLRSRDLALAPVEPQRPLHEESDPLRQGKSLELLLREAPSGRVPMRRHLHVVEAAHGGGVGGRDRRAGGGLANAIEKAHARAVTRTPWTRARARTTSATPPRTALRCARPAPP